MCGSTLTKNTTAQAEPAPLFGPRLWEDCMTKSDAVSHHNIPKHSAPVELPTEGLTEARAQPQKHQKRTLTLEHLLLRCGLVKDGIEGECACFLRSLFILWRADRARVVIKNLDRVRVVLWTQSKPQVSVTSISIRVLAVRAQSHQTQQRNAT